MPGTRRRRWIASSLLTTLLLMLPLKPSVAWAAPDEPACGTLRVGLRDYPRLYWRDAQGVYQGLDRDLFEALAQRTGCQMEIFVESQPRLWQGLRNGRLDLSSWVLPSDDRAKVVNLIPMLQVRPMAITWRDSPVQTEADFLADAQLSAVRIRQSLYGPGYDALFEQLRSRGRLSEAADFDSALRIFTARRMGLIVAYPWSVFGQSEQWMAQVRFSDWHPDASTVTSGLAISRSTVAPRQAKLLEDAVRAMQRDGTLARMVAKHLPMDLVKLAPQSGN
ncbi:substrate-binding periplasmic protein [Burkholderiaceae bacterium UC74_6]